MAAIIFSLFLKHDIENSVICIKDIFAGVLACRFYDMNVPKIRRKLILMYSIWKKRKKKNA